MRTTASERAASSRVGILGTCQSMSPREHRYPLSSVTSDAPLAVVSHVFGNTAVARVVSRR